MSMGDAQLVSFLHLFMVEITSRDTRGPTWATPSVVGGAHGAKDRNQGLRSSVKL